ncbi:tyrosine-type recombinase/integrase [Hymenobacter sp. BRD128]|uniref:site-specific integrase n=1 Tax=Hymenobacter sp. BRD128 TaxID=2675878 RepID=UPI00156345FA|nr:site-specific integrase [Hymenobacter sp. BRD128]QKG55204.1 tyrosine-type recombinase/integrase [Hymenobacter sp. BRD128]QKG55280.1 tyrosine-type recombinase/integrase [Hymenobacter sp. BRD128]
MNIHFERRSDRPDTQGRCVIHLRATFDGQRLRLATGERCIAADWNDKQSWFRKSFADLDNATLRLKALRNKLEDAYSDLRAQGVLPTVAALKAAMATANAPVAPAPGLVELLDEYLGVLVARGFRANTVKGYKTTRNAVTEWVATVPGGMTAAGYDATAHDSLLGWLRAEKEHGQNTIAGIVKHLKPFLAWARDDRKQTLSVDPAKLAVEWEDVEKCWLTADELDQMARTLLPNNLALVRDAFVFCCYTGLRYSDLHDLHAGNLHEWDGAKVLRLTQTKTRTGVSIYLTPPALALLARYTDTRAQLLPVMANAVMNRYLKRIARLAGVERPVEVVETIAGKLLKRAVPKWELVTMHTARHTFATQSLMRGMPAEVLQKVLGHAKIQTTLIYAKVVEDFQHQTMRRVWEGLPTSGPVANPSTVCAVELGAA